MKPVALQTLNRQSVGGSVSLTRVGLPSWGPLMIVELSSRRVCSMRNTPSKTRSVFPRLAYRVSHG